MITIYNAREKDFNNNGLWVLDNCIKAEVKEEKNGEYSLELEYPIFGNDKWKDIIEENIIKVPTPKYGDQLFRIKNKRVDGTILYVYAVHIFYDLMDNFLEDVRPTGTSGVGALNWILDNTQYPHKFRALSDIARVSTANYIRKNPVQALISEDDNSFLNRWSGELERDNFTVKMLQNAGTDRDTVIQFGKNLLEIEEDINSTEVTTRLMLTGLNEDDTVVILPEKYIDSAYIQAYPQPKIRHCHYSDFKVDLENGITLENVYTMLRNEAQRLYKVEKIDIPKVNYKVNFVELSKTEEYKNYAILEKVYLNDIVTTKHSKIGIDIKAQVISYRWDAINQKYLEIELGNFKDNINKSFQNLNNTLNKVADELSANKSDLQKAIDNATELLTSALGGYVVKREGEILIMDTEDIMTATKVWRWNLNGLGYSGTGVNGPYRLAITMDGAIVADFITTGVLSASLIKAGILKSFNGKTWINMENGTFNFANKVVYDGDKFTIQMGNKTLDEFEKEYEKTKQQTNKDIGEVQGSTNTLKNALGGYTADGILDKSEKQAIESLLKALNTEKADIDAQKNTVYYNQDFTGSMIAVLNDAYGNYIRKYNALIETINTVVSAYKVTQRHRDNINNAFIEHDKALANYSKAINDSIDSIAEKKKRDTKDYTDTKFEVLDTKIVGRVSKGEFGTYVEQNAQSVKIAWNKISNYIEFENGKLYARQPDGTYFELGVNGIRKHTSSGDKDLHYLTWVTTCTTSASVQGVVYVNLPSDFRGKNWSAYTAIYDTNNSGGANEAIQKAIAFTAVEDKVNNRVGVTGYTNVKDWSGGGLTTMGIGARVMVIA